MARAIEREERLASALRDNLRRRKAQARDAVESGTAADAPVTPAPDVGR